MTPVLQSHGKVTRPASLQKLDNLPSRIGRLWRREAAQRPSGSLLKEAGKDARRLSLVLLAALLPLLLLGLALLNHLTGPQTPASELKQEAEAASRALQRALEGHSNSVAALAAEPAIAAATRYAPAAEQRLEDFRAAGPGFQALAVVDRSGNPIVATGELYPLSWPEVPVFDSSQQGQTAIFPVTTGSPHNSQIDYLVFTAPIQDQTGPAALVVAGLMRTDALLGTVGQALYGDQAAAGAPGDFVKQVKRRMQLPAAGSGLRLVALTAQAQPDGSPGPDADTASLREYREVTPQMAAGPLYLLLEAWETPQGSAPLGGNLSLAMALGAVTLAITAGQIITRRPRPALARRQPGSEAAASDHRTGQGTVLPLATPQEVFQRLVAVQEAVRQEMADYLHGHVQSKLVALSIALGVCQQMLDRDPARACQMLERIQDELRKVQDEDVRRVSRELFPSIIKMGLAPALRSLVGRFSNFAEVELTIEPQVIAMDESPANGFLAKRRLGIYRVTEEALNNALKHASASRLQVSLERQGDRLVALSVVDNGVGFSPDGVVDSHGLLAMRDYAEAIGGRAEITSAPGQGTTVRLTLPLPLDETAKTRPVAAGATTETLTTPTVDRAADNSL